VGRSLGIEDCGIFYFPNGTNHWTSKLRNMTRNCKWLTFVLCFVLAGCALLNRSGTHHHGNAGRPPKQGTGRAQATPQPTPRRSHPPRQPETVPNERFAQLKSDLEERTRDRTQIASFVAGLRKIVNNTTLTNEKKRAIFSEIVSNASLTGKVKPNADALNNYYQDPNTTSSERRNLDASLASALSKMQRQP
jgi:hypothetical protein